MEGKTGGASIRRALKVLQSFSLEEPFLGVSEIARKVNLPKSSTYWLLKILQEEGYIYQDLKSNKYRLSVKLFHLGSVAGSTMDINYVAQPVMERLNDEIGETVNLYVLDGYERICIKKVEGTRLVREFVHLGQKVPAYCGAAGKVLMAWQSDDYIEKIISYTQLKPLTKNTITDVSVFKEELQKVKKEGCAISYGERDIEVASVAIPVFDETGKVTAALSVSGPVFRFIITEEIVRKVKNAAKEISYQLGYLEPVSV